MHKQPEPKPYLTTDNPQNSCEQVTTKKYDAFAVILSQRLLYLQDIFACSLMHPCRCNLFPICIISGYYIYKIEVVESLGSFLSDCLMQLAKKNHRFFSLTATRVTTLWLKQPICFCCVYNSSKLALCLIVQSAVTVIINPLPLTYMPFSFTLIFCPCCVSGF